MPFDDGSNSARARSARIRAEHDYEANELEAMQRRSAAFEARPRRVSLLTRISDVFGGMRGRPADAGDAAVIAEAAHVE
jgi:hypothetical protein